MLLLERETAMRELDQALQQAVGDSGRIFLISGEAGIGKTSLVEQFIQNHKQSVRVLWGACWRGKEKQALGSCCALAEGDSNAEIATRLHISPKTVDHHVSAVFG